MTVVLIILGVLIALLAVFFIGGLVVSARRRNRADFEPHVRAADQDLERARAEDKGWDRALMEKAARDALSSERPDFAYGDLHLVLVDDKPGVEEDRAHMVALGKDKTARVVLTRATGGEWILERVE